MKKIFSILILLSSVQSFAQKIVENKIDEFTKHSVKRTSWDGLTRIGGLNDSFTRLEKIEDTYWLNLKMMSSNVNSINKDAELMLMTVTDSIVTLYNHEFQITCTGCGSIGLVGSSGQGFNISFLISEDKVEYLMKNAVKKIRIYTTDGYIDKEVPEKNQKKFMKQLELIKS